MANEFTDQDWEELRALHARGGAAAVAAYINAEPDLAKRRAHWSFAEKSFRSQGWNGKSFDALIELVNTGIAESLRQLAAATDEREQYTAKEHANILMFNLSAELAECWPDDERAREQRHFEIGLRLAEDCIRIRRELGKPPERRALAFWAAGMHQLSLGNRWEAVGAFETAAGLAVEQVSGTARSRIAPGGDFAAILYEGYAGIARLTLGDNCGRARYNRAIEAFEGTASKFEGQVKMTRSSGSTSSGSSSTSSCLQSIPKDSMKRPLDSSVVSELVASIVIKAAAGEPSLALIQKLIAEPLEIGQYHMGVSPTLDYYYLGGGARATFSSWRKFM